MDKNDKKHQKIKGILLLIIAVSLTSCIIGFIIGHSVTTDYHIGYIVDTIPLSPEGKEEAAAAIYFNLCGNVLYTDGTPYANSRVELHSNPRYTYTDASGYFCFINVEPGQHTINVVRDGVVQASCTVNVDANENYTGSRIVQLNDGSFSIHISLDVSVLELTLVLDNDRITPQLSDRPFGQENESGLPQNSDQPAPPDSPENPDQPAPPVIPEPPAAPEPPLPPPPPVQGGGGSTPPPPAGTPDRAPSMAAIDQISGHSWSLLTSVDIFGERPGNHNTSTIYGRKVIAPGAFGSYQFRIKNTEDYVVEYGIRLEDEDENHPSIPMKYRLKAGSAYLDGNQWQTAADLQTGTKTLSPGSSEYYTLEWKWETVSDSNDTSIGSQTGNPRYILKIRISAQFK